MNERTPPRSTAEVAYGRTAESDTPPTEENTEATSDRSALDNDPRSPLLKPDRTAGLTSRWQEIQTRFVDEPQDAVRQADGLVAEVIQELATTFADQRQGLEDQWSRGTEVSTEDLRQALMQYRSFFQRLLVA